MKKKILQFTIANTKGGQTQYVLQNWKNIDKSKFHFDFITMSKKLDFVEELEKEGSKVFFISCYAEENEQKFNNELRDIIRKGNYDAIHIHTKQWKSFNVEKIAKEEGIKKIIIHAHNSGIDILDVIKRTQELNQHYFLQEQFTEDIATDYWACSKLAANFLYGNKLAPEKIKIMNNAIDLSLFSYCKETRDILRKKMNLDNYYVIGNVARLAYQKNQEFLLKVFTEICKVRNNYKLLLVGDGEKLHEYKTYVREMKIEDKVIFTGKRNDVHNLLQVMDLFCLPSRFEGLSISLVEAQAAGLKCLCSDGLSEELKITDNVKVLPLEVETWKNTILGMRMPYDRKDMKKIITDAGYNILSQIKILENYYKN